MRRVLQYSVYLIFYGITYVVGVLPRWIFYGLADVLAFQLAYLFRYRRGVVLGNLRRSFPERDEGEIRRLAWRFYRHLADLLLESAFMMHASSKRIVRRCEFTNVEVMEPYYQQSRSVVIAAAHYCNWEFLTCAAPIIPFVFLGIYKPVGNRWVEGLLTRSRQRLGAVAVEMKDTLRTILRYEHEGKPVLAGLIADQTPWKGNHYWGHFLNQDTLVFRGVEHVAKKIDAPVFFCHMRQPKRGYFSVTLEFITDTPRETPEDWITAQHLAALERCIRERPEYWLWSHRRWKHQKPAGDE